MREPMNTSLRLLGVVAVAVAFAGAGYAAFTVYDQDAEVPTTIELSGPAEAQPTPPGGEASNPVLVDGGEASNLVLVDGGSTSATLQAENTGARNATVTFSSPTDGFSYETDGEVEVPANGTAPVRGTLAVEAGNVGENQTVTVVAQRADTGSEVASLDVGVDVIESQAPTLTLTPNAPGTLPGTEATVRVVAENPIDVEQTLNLTVDGPRATLESQQLTVSGGGTGYTLATVQVPQEATGTLDVSVTGTTEDRETTDAGASIPVVGEGELVAGAVVDELTLRSGERFGVPVIVVSGLDQPVDVTASGEHVVDAEIPGANATSATGGFVTVEAPADARDPFTTTVTLTAGDETRTLELEVDPSPDGRAAEPGTQVSADYVGRLADGGVFDTSLPAVAHGPFEKAEQFRARGGLQPLEIPLNPQRPGVVQGFYDLLVDLSEGESRTAVLTPDEAYGPTRTHENRSATTEINRVDEVTRFLRDIPRQQLPPDFNISEKEEGDEITYTVEQGGEEITFRFELLRKSEDTVDLERLAEIGETTTFYPTWPNATEVTDKNETHIFYETTPPEDTGAFTWDANPNSHEAQWENATTVQSVNETTIVLLHQPEEGTTYEVSSSPRQPPSTYRVEAVGPEEIHVSTPNDHPLAGETLVFDVTLGDVSEREAPSGPTIGGGGPR